MNILFIRSNPVDPDTRVEKEINSLLKYGHKIEVVAWDRSNNYFIKETTLDLENGEAKIYRFGIKALYGGGIKKNLGPLINFQWRLYRWLQRNINNYDAIHACDFDTAFISKKVALRNKKKFIYDIFDYYVDSFNVPAILKKTISKLDYKIINSADATFICSEKRQEQIRGSNPKRLVVLHNSPPETRFEETDFRLDSSKIKLVYVGILEKGRFIKEIAELVKKDQRYEFHVGGFGNLENYFEENSKNYNNIYFYGRLPYKKTLELESKCDIMTAIYNPKVPNHYYAAPNKFYEALMLGKPVIMAKNTGMDEVVNINDVGIVIDYTTESFKEGLTNLSRRRDEWEAMSFRMKELYKNNYSWNEMEKRLISTYNEIGIVGEKL